MEGQVTSPVSAPAGTSSPAGAPPRSKEWKAGYARGYIRGAEHQQSRNIRYREGTFEMRCGGCMAGAGGNRFWPLTEEFWNPRNLQRCRACLLIRKRENARAIYYRDKARIQADRAKYYALNRDVILLKKRARYEENRLEKIAANARYAQANAERIRLYRKVYYAENRDRILRLEKERRARKAAA